MDTTIDRNDSIALRVDKRKTKATPPRPQPIINQYPQLHIENEQDTFKERGKSTNTQQQQQQNQKQRNINKFHNTHSLYV